MPATATSPSKPRLPRYQIAEMQLVQRIAKGDYSAGQRLAGIDDLADDLGVSPSTLRQSLQSLAAKGILECVPGRGTSVSRNAMGIIGGSPALTGRGKAYSLIVPDIRYLEFSTLAHSVQDAVREQKIELMIYNTEDNLDRYVEELHRTLDSGTQGIVLVPPLNVSLPLESLIRLKDAGIPVVTCYRPIEVLPIPSLRQDTFATHRKAAEHLIATGCRVLGLVHVQVTSPVNRQFFREGLHGHKHAIMEHKLDYRDEHVLNLDTPGLNYQEWAACFASDGRAQTSSSQELRVQHVVDWLRANPGVDGIVCYNDYLVPIVAEALTRLNRKVPDDVSIIARGSLAFQGYAMQPVTLMDVNLAEYGHRAFGLLQRMAAGERFEPGYFETIDSTLIERSTTRPLTQG